LAEQGIKSAVQGIWTAEQGTEKVGLRRGTSKRRDGRTGRVSAYKVSAYKEWQPSLE
jgi:hypothetical protein